VNEGLYLSAKKKRRQEAQEALVEVVGRQLLDWGVKKKRGAKKKAVHQKKVDR